MPLRADRRRFLGMLARAAALAALPAALARSAAAGIYQRIWDADLAGRGIRAITLAGRGDPDQGYVRVDEAGGREPGHRLFAEVRIPERKRLTYDLCRRLFDNYRLDQTRAEDATPDEARETLALLEATFDSLPMRAARAHLEQQRGRAYDDGAWQELIFNVWFRPFDDGRNRDLSGFEHVVVGEQRGGRVNGYHFWYKYYLEDGIGQDSDAIEFDGLRYGGLAALGETLPEVVTLAFRWQAPDPDSGATRPLYKPVGGFFVGCSVEGLMAQGLVRFFEHGRVETTINRGRYELDLYRSPDGQSLRSTFPRLLGLA